MAAQFNKVGAAAEDDATGLSKVAELLPVLARYNALPLTSGDAETLDAHLTSLIRYLLYLIKKRGPGSSRLWLAGCILHMASSEGSGFTSPFGQQWILLDLHFQNAVALLSFTSKCSSLVQSACFWWM